MIKFYDDGILLKPEPVEPVRTVKKSHLAKDERRYTARLIKANPNIGQYLLKLILELRLTLKF